MKKSQNRQREFKGSITAFLSLVFILLLSLIGAMLQSASIQATKSIKRADMNLAVENLFAEYQVELLKKYDLFAREGNKEKEICERLEFYGIIETDHEIVGTKLLSDANGEAFFEQAIKCMGGTSDGSEILESDLKDSKESDEAEEQLETLLSEEGQVLATEDNPIEVAKKLKSLNLLTLIYPSEEQLSNRNVQLSSLPTHRTLEKGVGNIAIETIANLTEKTLFSLYLTSHFSNVVNPSVAHPLAYEVEYLLGGKGSDKENLKIVAGKILSIRVAVNYAYLLTDQTKQAEAQALAVGLCSLMTAPEAAAIVKQAILSAWAYGESILDLRVLMKAKKVPLVKTAENWQLQLSNLYKLASGELTGGEGEFQEGITYEEYLKALLLAEEKPTLCMRSLDLLELNTGIRADTCLTELEIESTCQLRGGITYTFVTNYKYE